MQQCVFSGAVNFVYWYRCTFRCTDKVPILFAHFDWLLPWPNIYRLRYRYPTVDLHVRSKITYTMSRCLQSTTMLFSSYFTWLLSPSFRLVLYYQHLRSKLMKIVPVLKKFRDVSLLTSPATILFSKMRLHASLQWSLKRGTSSIKHINQSSNIA